MEDYVMLTGLKLRFLTALVLFVIFFFCQSYSYPIFGIETAEIIDRISDNRYYTFLENCDIVKWIQNKEIFSKK